MKQNHFTELVGYPFIEIYNNNGHQTPRTPKPHFVQKLRSNIHSRNALVNLNFHFRKGPKDFNLIICWTSGNFNAPLNTLLAFGSSELFKTIQEKTKLNVGKYVVSNIC